MDSPSIETILAIGGGIISGALFAAMEESLNAFGDARRAALAEGHDWRAALATRLIREEEGIRARLLVARVIALGITAGTAGYIARSLGLVPAVAVALVATLVSAVVAEILVTVVARRELLGLRLLRWFRWLELAFWPVAWPVQLAGRAIEAVLPESQPSDAERMTELVVEHMIEQGEERGSIPEDHAELLLRVLEFKNTVAREVMVPRTQTVAIELSTPLVEAIDVIVDSGHSRYPVYRDRMDQIEGVLYAKDLFKLIQEKGELEGVRLSQIIRRPAYFTLESEKIGSLLREMQARGVHLAVVVDEFGGTSGIVTLEDILEEIVGDIRDEHDIEEVEIEQLEDGRYEADAGMSVYDLEEILGAPIKNGEDGYDTLGGLVVGIAGRVPEIGEQVQAGPFDLRVLDRDDRHVSRVEIVRRDAAESTSESSANGAT